MGTSFSHYRTRGMSSASQQIPVTEWALRPWQRRRPRYALRQARRLPATRRAVCRDFVAWFAKRWPATHHVPIEIRATKWLERPSDGKKCAGLAWLPNDEHCSRSSPIIYVAGARDSMSVLTALAHELAHYRAWCRTNDATERGKELAEMKLLDQFFRESGRWRRKQKPR